jgi:hypothetical protein
MSQKAPNVMPIGTRRPAPPAAPPAAPEFRPRFTPEGLDLLINRVVEKTVASLRAREAAERQRKA